MTERRQCIGEQALRDGLAGAEAAARTITYLEKTAGAEDLACLVVEPVQAEAGVRIPSADFLPALRRRCTEVGALLVLDEVETIQRVRADSREKSLNGLRQLLDDSTVEGVL